MEANHPAWIRFSSSSVAVQAGSRLRWLTLLLHHTRHASEAKARKMHTAASWSDEPPEREREDPRFWRVGRNFRGLFLGPWGCSFCDTRHEEWWVRTGWPELSDVGTRQGFFGFFYVFCGEISQLGEFSFSENEKRNETFVIFMDSFRHFSKLKKN